MSDTLKPLLNAAQQASKDADAVMEVIKDAAAKIAAILAPYEGLSTEDVVLPALDTGRTFLTHANMVVTNDTAQREMKAQMRQQQQQAAAMPTRIE